MNEWTNSAGYEVVHRDLVGEASDLDERLRGLGSVSYIWVPRRKRLTPNSIQTHNLYFCYYIIIFSSHSLIACCMANTFMLSVT